jgi:hypothetical protein
MQVLTFPNPSIVVSGPHVIVTVEKLCSRSGFHFDRLDFFREEPCVDRSFGGLLGTQGVLVLLFARDFEFALTQDVFVLGGKRTPMGEYVGALKDIPAIELGAIASRAALETTGVAPEEIDHTIVGNALQTSGDAIYGARHVALKAGIPFDRPALTVNRLCGSGIQAIISGAQMIQLGEARTCLVGGMESMSQAPHVIRGARSGFALGQGKLEDSLMVALL